MSVAETVDWRVLGAVRFVDAIGGRLVADRLAVTGDGLRWLRNRSGHHVLALAPGLEAHAGRFAAPPAGPPAGSVTAPLSVRDPGGRWLARRAVVRLPRDPDPEHAARAASLFRAVDVALFPSPVVVPPPGWAVVRAAVRGDGGRPLAGALVRMRRRGDEARIGWGMTDGRGEALVAAPGLPTTASGEDDEGPVLVREVAVTLDVLWDPAAGAAPDPDALEAEGEERLVRSVDATVRPGAVVTMAI
jgi:hypothetical protein